MPTYRSIHKNLVLGFMKGKSEVTVNFLRGVHVTSDPDVIAYLDSKLSDVELAITKELSSEEQMADLAVEPTEVQKQPNKAKKK